MAKQLNVSLAFSADTSRAKAQLKDLQSQLNNLSNKTILKVDVDNSEIHSAVQDIAKLQAQIKSSTNQKTGLLDLGKFNESMAKSNMSLEKYQKTLSSLGSDGQKAFLSLTNSIINAETPLRRTNALLDEMKTTLANTARWQLSSSVLHGFMGAIQGAYGYAQDLNESLNNIRIVTGQSVEQMAKFAKEANTAAKALSTTTTEYTDAALIYYQQGLNDQEVKERTDATIKMANVSRQSAEIVSDQMTSVWNNFYDGSKSLEYYSDVMVKLGAATASSSEEIATGLEKFSAVSNTVGLSYEYAAAALATVTAQTRQSADTVGTAFRTLFTRLEGLSLGETAEDGTNLNKYSEALLKVGVNIKDQQGQLKDMDQILDELGSKWSTIGKEQQVALAQTVGGARQYATLIALMDNWDFFQENLSTAYGSSGALQEQADIYAESWEAARDRVTAALEDIYDSLLKDDFFIGITDGLATVLNLIGDVVDGMGGFTGVLSLASTMAIKLFSKDIAKGLENFSYNLKSLTGLNKKENLESKLEAINLSGKMTIDSGTAEGSAWNAIMKNEALLNKAFIDNAENMNDAQKLQIQFEMDSLKVLKEQVVEKSKLLDLTEKENQELIKKFQRESGVGAKKFTAEKDKLIGANKNYLEVEDFLVNISKSQGKLSSSDRKKLFNLAKTKDNQQEIDDNLLEELSQKASENAQKQRRKAVKTFKKNTQLDNKSNEEIFEIIDLDTKYQELKANVDQTTKSMETSIKETAKNIENFGVKTYTVTEKMAAWTQVGMSAVTMLTTISGIIGTLNDDSLTPWEKFTTILGTLVMTAPMLITTIGSAIPVIKGAAAVTTEAAVATGTASVALNSLIWPISLVVIGLTALIAAWAWFETEHSFTGQLRKANEELERMQKAAANTSSSYEDLKSSITSLESARDTLAGLTKGTEEWNDAVFKLNQQVIDLIDKYPELAQYMDSSEGILSISEEGMQKVLESQREQAQAMQVAVLGKQRDILALENKRTKNEAEGLSYEKMSSVLVPTYNSQEGQYTYEKKDSITTVELDAKSLAELGQQILAKDALNKDGTIDFSKINSDLEIHSDALNENIDTILSLATQFESLDNQLSAMDENLASSWLNSIGIDGEFNEFLSKGMAKSIDTYRSQTESVVNWASKDQIIEAYAQITGSSITAIEDAIANEKITLDDLKDTVITNSIHTQAFQEYENQLNSLSSLKGQAGYDTLKNIIASGGDESSYNALTEGQLKELQQLLFTDTDGTLKSDIAELFNKNPEIFGEGFSEKLSSALTDANYSINAQKERDKRHQAKLSDTAAALGVDEEALEGFVNHLEASEEGLEDNKEAALEAAEAIIRYSRGAEKLAETFKDNEEALKETNKGTWEYYEALGEIQQAASEMFVLDLNTEYVEEHLDDLRKAAEGDETAIKNLQSTMATSWAKDFAAGVENGTNLLTEQAFNAEDWRNRFTSSVEAVNASLASMSDSFTLEEALAKGDQSVKNLIDTVNEAAAAGKMSAEEIDALFGSMGYSPEIKWEEVDGPATKWDATANILGFPITVSGETSNKIAVPQIADADKNGSTSLTKISTSRSLSSNIKAGGNKASGSQKDAKKASDEIERYHVIKEQMEDINNELDKISKAKDRAFGGDKLKLMDDEIAKTEELVEAQKEYLRQIESYYGADRAAIAAYGAQFDENGVITNYDALISAQIAKFNAARTDAAEEEFEKFKDVLEQYEETSDLVAEERQKLIDQENELADLLLEKLQYEIELKIEIEDDDLKYLDFLLKQVNDSAYEAADAIALLGQKTQSTFNKIDAYTEGINKLFQNHGFVGDITELLGDNSTDLLAIAEAYSFTEEEVETLREYKDGLMESTEQLMDLQQEIRDKVIPAFEDLTAEMDEEIDKLNHLSTMLNHYGNIIDIIGKDTLGISDELIESLDVAKVNNAINQVESSYVKLNGMRQSRAEVEQQLEDARAEGNEGLISYWEEVLAELDVQIADATENMASSLEEALQQIADSYDAAVQRSIERFEKAMSGTYGSLEALQDAYDKQQEVNERYLEDYEQIYELNKLNRDISNSIDNTDNIKGKQMLIELQKEINDLEDAGVKLSEYDVNFLRQKYELRLAEIALEEAQNAKSQVRMTRDSEGNWSYTYTADQQNIADAQQNYEDVLFETQQLSTEYINNLQGQIIDAQIAMNQELAQLREDDEEGRQRVLDHYQGQIDYLTSQLQAALDNNKLIYEQDWQAYHDSTGYKISDQDEFLMNFENTNLSIMSGYDTLQGYQEAFTEASSLLYDELNEATTNWQDATERAMQAAGTSVQTFAQDMDTAVNGSGGIVDQSNAAKESVTNMGQTMATTFGTVLDAVDNFETNYGHLINGVIADNNVLISSCNDIIKAWAQVDAAERRESFNTYNPQTGGTTDVSIKDTAGKTFKETSVQGEYKVKNDAGDTVKVFSTKTEADNYAASLNSRSGQYRHGADSYFWVDRFASGGYTGTWGTTAGKLAMLHEKELVLNKDDTVNFLKAINIVRELVGWLDTQAGLMSLPKLHASQLNYLSEGLEQNVIIDAHFPNATNKDEIKAAFHDLINRAAQYSNRKG